MKRLSNILLVVLALAGLAAVGVVVFLRFSARPSVSGTPLDGSFPQSGQVTVTTSTTTPIGGTPETQNAVVAAFSTQLPADNADNIKPYQTAVSENYAIQVWKGDNMGGEALLKYDTTAGTWSVVTMGGGAWNLEGLEAQGVPIDIARALLEEVPH